MRKAWQELTNVAKNGMTDRMGCKPGPLVSTKYVLPLNTFSTLLLNINTLEFQPEINNINKLKETNGRS